MSSCFVLSPLVASLSVAQRLAVLPRAASALLSLPPSACPPLADCSGLFGGSMLAQCTRDGREPLGTTANDELLRPAVRKTNLDAVRNQEQRAARPNNRDVREFEVVMPVWKLKPCDSNTNRRDVRRSLPPTASIPRHMFAAPCRRSDSLKPSGVFMCRAWLTSACAVSVSHPRPRPPACGLRL